MSQSGTRGNSISEHISEQLREPAVPGIMELGAPCHGTTMCAPH